MRLKILSACLLALGSPVRPADGPAILAGIPDNTWIKLPVTPSVVPIVSHTNITVDCDSGRVFLYGSDTHGNVNNNAVWYLRLSDLTWRPVYPDDAPSTYVKVTGPVLGAGEFWAATSTGHPVASHVFDAQKYMPGKHCILALLFDKHNPTVANALSGVTVTWDNAGAYVGRPTAWLFDTRALKWVHLKNGPAPDVFTYAMGASTDGQVAVASTPGATCQFNWADSTWTTLSTTGPRPTPYATSMEFDFSTQKFVVAGGSQSFTYSSYDAAGKSWALTQSTGPSMNGAHIGYDTLNRVLIAHAVDGSNSYSNPSGNAVTYVRPSLTGVWTPVKRSSAGDTLPPNYGFSHRAEYDLRHNVFYYMTGRELWAYRYKKKAGTAEEGRRQRAEDMGQMTISPNPFDSRISIAAGPDLKPEEFKFELCDLRGRPVADFIPAARGTYQLNSGRLRPGVYVVHWTGRGKAKTRKVLKVH